MLSCWRYRAEGPGGVLEVAEGLDAELDIFLVRKLGMPGHREYAMGAIASGGIRVLNDEVVQYLNIRRELIDAVAEREQTELERREAAYRHGFLSQQQMELLIQKMPNCEYRQYLQDLIEELIRTHKPAHAGYELEVQTWKS